MGMRVCVENSSILLRYQYVEAQHVNGPPISAIGLQSKRSTLLGGVTYAFIYPFILSYLLLEFLFAFTLTYSMHLTIAFLYHSTNSWFVWLS